MCGRYLSKDQPAIGRYFNVTTRQYKLTDRYDVAPNTTVPVVRIIDGERVLSGM
jgi:putative SOS response-associated peptidase YedK